MIIKDFNFIFDDNVEEIVIDLDKNKNGSFSKKFAKLTNLKKVTIKNINKSYSFDWAFYNCAGLEEVYIDDISNMNCANMFCNCFNLKKVTINKGNPSESEDMFFGSFKLEKVKLPKEFVISEQLFEYTESNLMIEYDGEYNGGYTVINSTEAFFMED